MVDNPGLKIVQISEGRDRASMIAEFDGVGTTWIVADVRSKLAIQNRLLKKNKFCEGLAVLRASELWTLILRRVQPDLQIVSRELISAAIAACLHRRQEQWLHAPGAAKTVFEYIKQLLPILSSNIPFDDWFDQQENLASRERWFIWYKIAFDVWSEVCRERLCAAAWVPGALAIAKSDVSSVFERALIVDLGAELSHLEADLLLELAKNRPVTIFRPTPIWEGDYPDGRLAVDWMEKQAESRGVRVTKVALHSNELCPSAVIYKRLPSAIAEVKEAVARVRMWLEAGVRPQHIAIVSPDLESYWTILSLHLESEGIATNKPVVSMLHSFSDVMRWLARLRIRTGVPEPRDLEVDLFGQSSPPLSFGSFREIFTRIYEAADLELSAELQKHFAEEYSDRGRWDQGEILARDQFLLKALAVLREGDDQSRAIRLFKTILEECPPDLLFDSTQWVRYICDLASRVEIPVLAADPFGISCLNLASLESMETSHVVIMGLHEGALRSKHGTVIHTFDLRSIEKYTGFVIDGEDRKRVEFEARWILSQPRIETHLLFADADLSGTVQTPSWSWISGAWAQKSETPEITVALESRFDQLQKRDFNFVGSGAQRARIDREAGRSPQPKFAAKVISKNSATTIDQISKCPLRFAFDRLLGPRDDGFLDLDADRSRYGRLQHKIFELLGQRQWRAHSDDELIAVIEEARLKFDLREDAKIVRTEQAWLSLRRRLVKIARWLLEFEQEQRRRWPTLRTVGTEVSISGLVGSHPLTGSIDRIDQMADGRLILIDYKNRAVAQNFNSWSKRNFWQPLVYAYAVEQGWTQGVDLNGVSDRVAGIFIYDIRDRSRGSGLRLRDGNEDIFDFTSRSKGQTREELDRAFEELKKTIKTVNDRLDEGTFFPEPDDQKECLRCRWRVSCRAPHLELL